MGHALVRLAGEIDWEFLDRRFASTCAPGPGQPPLPTRLVAGLFILKHMHNLSDEVLCARSTSRSEEHTSELQSLMRISYAVFCLKKKKNKNRDYTHVNMTKYDAKKQHTYRRDT